MLLTCAELSSLPPDELESVSFENTFVRPENTDFLRCFDSCSLVVAIVIEVVDSS